MLKYFGGLLALEVVAILVLSFCYREKAKLIVAEYASAHGFLIALIGAAFVLL